MAVAHTVTCKVKHLADACIEQLTKRFIWQECNSKNKGTKGRLTLNNENLGISYSFLMPFFCGRYVVECLLCSVEHKKKTEMHKGIKWFYLASNTFLCSLIMLLYYFNSVCMFPWIIMSWIMSIISVDSLRFYLHEFPLEQKLNPLICIGQYSVTINHGAFKLVYVKSGAFVSMLFSFCCL